MKIAVFGDSYGDIGKGEVSEKSNSWVNHLTLRCGGDITVTNFCFSGSSLYYSIQLFLKNQHNFDKVIFLITSFGRIEINNDFVNMSKSEHFVNRFTGYNHAMYVIEEYNDDNKKHGNHNYNKFDAVVYQAVADYYLYIQNVNFDIFQHNLMVEKIKSVRPNTLTIDCFRNLTKEYKNTFYLKQVSDLDLIYYSKQKSATIADRRHSHLNDENNIILADKIYDWIKTGNISLNVSDFVNPTAPPEYYGF